MLLCRMNFAQLGKFVGLRVQVVSKRRYFLRHVLLRKNVVLHGELHNLEQLLRIV